MADKLFEGSLTEGSLTAVVVAILPHLPMTDSDSGSVLPYKKVKIRICRYRERRGNGRLTGVAHARRSSGLSKSDTTLELV